MTSPTICPWDHNKVPSFLGFTPLNPSKLPYQSQQMAMIIIPFSITIPWIPINSHEFPWIPMNFPWIPMNSHEFSARLSTQRTHSPVTSVPLQSKPHCVAPGSGHCTAPGANLRAVRPQSLKSSPQGTQGTLAQHGADDGLDKIWMWVKMEDLGDHRY